MGRFDRWLKTGAGDVNSDHGEAVLAESGAGRQLEEGIALEKQGRIDEALRCYDSAIGLKPELARAHFNRGNILLDRGDAASALAAYTEALKFKPDSAGLHYNIGNAHLRLKQTGPGIAACRRAIALKPDFSDAYITLGVALQEQGRPYDAMACYRNAITITSGSAEAHNNLGSILYMLGHFAEALTNLRIALRIKPDFAQACSNVLLVQNFLSELPDGERLIDVKRYGELVTRLARPLTVRKNSPDPARCLRVGFVSANLSAHPVAYFFEAVVAALKAQTSGRSELFAYSVGADADNTTARLKGHFHEWREAAEFSDEVLAEKIRDDGIDILIDLSGHTPGNRLPVFAWRPAPVQVSWLGYFATTGVPPMDYLIADPWTLPPSEEANFTEKIWRLPETRLCLTPPSVDLHPSPLPAMHSGHVTFGCFNNLTKMNDVVVALWARILDALPTSRLFLMAQQLTEASIQKEVIERFSSHGIQAERLILSDAVPRADYLAAYHRVDIALDPFPYTGGTTTVEALWMGVPTLTMAGKHFLGRQGVGLMMNAGLPDWIATDSDDYVHRAVSHAKDLHGLALLRGRLRQQVLASPIFNAARFARHFETALRDMWIKWCTKETGVRGNGQETP